HRAPFRQWRLSAEAEEADTEPFADLFDLNMLDLYDVSPNPDEKTEQSQKTDTETSPSVFEYAFRDKSVVEKYVNLEPENTTSLQPETNGSYVRLGDTVYRDLIDPDIINGKRINTPTTIKSGYEIRIANVCLIYQLSYLQNKYGADATKSTSDSNGRVLGKLLNSKITIFILLFAFITALAIYPPKWLSDDLRYLNLTQQIKSLFHRQTNNNAAVLTLKNTWPTQRLPANHVATSPALNKISGKPGLAIIIADDSGKVRAINGVDGKKIFEVMLNHKILSPVNTLKHAVNQPANLVVAHYNGQVSLLDPKGQILWQSAASLNFGHFIHRPISADSNGDGVSDIVLASSEQGLIALDGNRSGWLLWQSKDLVLGKLSATPISADLNQDGHNDFVTVSDSGQVLALTLNKGMIETLWQQQLDPIRFTSPCLIPGDPLRISVVTERNELIALNALDGSVAWQANLGSLHLSSPIAGKINDDDNHDIFTVSYDGLVQGFDGLNGEMIWQQQLSNRVLANPAILDLDSDDRDDIIIADSAGNLHILSGKTGVYLLEKFAVKDADSFIASPLLGDINGNGLLDLVTISRNGLINSFELNRSSPLSQQAPWPIFLGNEQHASP
ncbi:MAG: hypothetical protein COA42_05725, partial [Alteromonadaceae bacterium]